MGALDGPTKDAAGAYSPRVDPLPEFQAVMHRYRARFARTEGELHAIQRLRYEVFNRELGEGLAESERRQLDQDRFDEHCHHLLVESLEDGAVIGTYRMQTSEMAALGHGFYSDGEFDFSGWPREILDSAVETGRACIAKEHRHRQVLLLLWKGLGHYALSRRKRYIFGCCSIGTQDEAEAGRTWEYLKRNGHHDPTLPLPARELCQCRFEPSDLEGWDRVRLPQLFRTYLRYGAKVVGDPAIDREFQTVDYLALLDMQKLDPVTILRQFELDLQAGA